MGAAASRLSDLIIVTSDNPRTEDPVRIMEEVCRGLTSDTLPSTRPAGSGVLSGPKAGKRAAAADHRRSSRCDCQGDPTGAGGDLVLIAGKGHEKATR